MCFAPQRCSLFRHLNFQKCSEPDSFSQFWRLRNVFRATTACNFSSLISPDGSAAAALASRGHKTFATFPPFRAPASSFFWLPLLWSSSFSLSLLWLFPPLPFHLSILSEVSLLNFLRLTIEMGMWSGYMLECCFDWNAQPTMWYIMGVSENGVYHQIARLVGKTVIHHQIWG